MLNSSSSRVLPSMPDSDTQLTLSARLIDRNTSTPRGYHSYWPFFLEYSILAEYHLLQKQKLPGIYVMPSYASLLEWTGVLFVRQGLYQGAIFPFKLNIPENYPDGDCPEFTFTPPIFHPLVDPETGALDTRPAFAKWRRNVNHLWQILLYARRVFYKIDMGSASGSGTERQSANPQAAMLYEKDINLFKHRVCECVESSKELASEFKADTGNDPYSIRFSELKDEEFSKIKSDMLDTSASTSHSSAIGHTPTSHPADETANYTSPRGYSWVQSGQGDIFSSKDSAVIHV